MENAKYACTSFRRPTFYALQYGGVNNVASSDTRLITGVFTNIFCMHREGKCSRFILVSHLLTPIETNPLHRIG